MKCDKCGTELPDPTNEYHLSYCRDVLVTKLAERDAEVARLREALTYMVRRGPETREELSDWDHADVYSELASFTDRARQAIASTTSKEKP